MEDWPLISFGYPLIRQTLEIEDPVLRTEMEKHFKARSQFIDTLYMYVFTITLTEEQLHYFRSWHKYKIANGADWFNMPVKSGASVVNQETRFMAIYKVVRVDPNLVQIVMPLTTRTDSVPNEAAYDAWEAGL